MNGNSCWATSCWLTLHVTSDVSVGWQKWLVFSVYQFFWLFLCKATNSLQVEDFKYLKEKMADYIESKPLITLLKCCFYISYSILIVWLVWWFWEIFLYLWEGWYVWIIYSFNVSTNVLHIFFYPDSFMEQKIHYTILLGFRLNMKNARCLSEEALRSLLLTFPAWSRDYTKLPTGKTTSWLKFRP